MNDGKLGAEGQLWDPVLNILLFTPSSLCQPYAVAEEAGPSNVQRSLQPPLCYFCDRKVAEGYLAPLWLIAAHGQSPLP